MEYRNRRIERENVVSSIFLLKGSPNQINIAQYNK